MYNTAHILNNNLVRQFFEAVRKENFPKIEDLLNKGVSITLKDNWNEDKQVLHIACENRFKQGSIDRLIALGADANATTKSGLKPLHIAARMGLSETMVSLIKAGATVDALTHNKMSKTPLCEAAVHGQADAIRILKAAGADVNYRDPNDELQAVHLACSSHIQSQEIRQDTKFAILGAEEGFKSLVSEELAKWNEAYDPQNHQERNYINYIERLQNIDASNLSPEDYFSHLVSALDEGYDANRNSMVLLKKSILKYWKQYEQNKQKEEEFRAIFSEAACAIPISLPEFS